MCVCVCVCVCVFVAVCVCVCVVLCVVCLMGAFQLLIGVNVNNRFKV